MRRHEVRGLLAVLITAGCWMVPTSAAQAAPPFTLITDGFALDASVRPALSEDGTVVAAEAQLLHVGA